ILSALFLLHKLSRRESEQLPQPQTPIHTKVISILIYSKNKNYDLHASICYGLGESVVS
ncbi:hypothetical protein DVH24_042672, partial [Malus domestica]